MSAHGTFPVASAFLTAYAFASSARAEPEIEGGPPEGDAGPGDRQQRLRDGPPLPVKRVDENERLSALGALEGVLAGAAGQDPTGPPLLPRLGPIDELLRGAFLQGARAQGADGAADGVEIVPLPNVSFSRNEGATGGVIVPIFVKNKEGDVDRVIAPVFTYNRIFGLEVGAHALAFMNDLALGAGVVLSSRIARNIYFEATDETVLDSRFAFELFLKNEVDPASRFYGFGPATTSDDETNDTHRETVLRINSGVNLPLGLQVFWRQRFRHVRTSGGRVEKLLSTPDVFPFAPGIPTATVDGNALELRWDQRDETFLPREGFSMGALAELNTGIDGETGRFYPRWVVDARGYTTPLDGAVTFAGRFRFERLTGSRVPFYEQAILGGRNSLRAYGEDRFTDLASLLFQVEARVTVLDIEIRGARTQWSVVPFFDYGRVFHDFRSGVFRLWRWSPGVGFHLAVAPHIVGRVDVGFGSEGANAFVGVGLPF